MGGDGRRGSSLQPLTMQLHPYFEDRRQVALPLDQGRARLRSGRAPGRRGLDDGLWYEREREFERESGEARQAGTTYRFASQSATVGDPVWNGGRVVCVRVCTVALLRCDYLEQFLPPVSGARQGGPCPCRKMPSLFPSVGD